MIRLMWRNLMSNRVRLVLTTFAVVLGVSFLVASFVLTDGLRASMRNVSRDIVGGIELEVTHASAQEDAPPIPIELVDRVAAVEGVDQVTGVVFAEGVAPITPDGEVLTTFGPPMLGLSWVSEPALSTMTLIEGRAPQGMEEFTMDIATIEREGFTLGERYGVATTTGRYDLELVGATSFGQDNITMGTVMTQYDLPLAQTMFGQPGMVSSVHATIVPSADAAEVAHAVERSVAEATTIPLAVLDQQTMIANQQAGFDAGVSIFGNVMLGFAIITVVVSVFIIANTFAMLLNQRMADIALLRAIGATQGQIWWSTMAEAATIGVLASLLGLGLGVGIAVGLQALISRVGMELPAMDITLAPRTIIVAFAVGIGVILVSAAGAVRRAARTSPMAALRHSEEAPMYAGRGRAIGAGVAVLAAVILGIIGTQWGLSVGRQSVSLAGAAVAVLTALALAGPFLLPGALNLLARITARGGPALGLSTANAGRNPRRTSATAASLTIGLALVTAVLIVGESFKQTIDDTIADQVSSDVVSSPEAISGRAYTDALHQLGIFDSIAGVRFGEIDLGPSHGAAEGQELSVAGSEIEALSTLFDLGVDQGSLPQNPNEVLISSGTARQFDWAVGEHIDAVFPTGEQTEYTIAGIYSHEMFISESLIISTDQWRERFGTDDDWWVSAQFRENVNPAQGLALAQSLEQEFPHVTLLDRDGYVALVHETIDQSLAAVNLLLALAIIIALIGIANTIALSVVERRRELGLLRALGMTKRQTRIMIRSEAVQISLIGAISGIAVGVLFGWVLTIVLPPSFIDTLAVPYARLGLMMLACAVAGLIAASLPVRRAGRTTIVEAIAS